MDEYLGFFWKKQSSQPKLDQSVPETVPVNLKNFVNPFVTRLSAISTIPAPGTIKQINSNS